MSGVFSAANPSLQKDISRIENNTDSLLVNLHIIFPPNTDPEVSTSLPDVPANADSITVQFFLDERITFTVFGNDADGDLIDLNALIGGGFDFTQLGIDFTAASGVGNISSVFSMQPTCDQLRQLGAETFTVSFVVNDDDFCKRPNADTLHVTFELLPPPNALPVLTAQGLQDGDTITINAGDAVDIPFVGTDADGDSLFLRLVPFTGNLSGPGFTFTNQSGVGTVSSQLTWATSCETLGQDSASNNQTILPLQFVVADNYCLDPGLDSLNLTIVVNDIQAGGTTTLPPNVFTPNGDGINEVYTIPQLPAETCNSAFMSISIYNRWGKEVYFSEARNFAWDGANAASGVYYYLLRYSNETTFKGNISLIR